MGLDSVELVMEIENYFGIEIPDAEAEKIYTVQKMVDTVAGHLNVSTNNYKLRDTIFQRVISSIPLPSTSTNHIRLTDNIAAYLSPADKAGWALFKNNLGLDVPKPDIKDKNSNRFSDKLKRFVHWNPGYAGNTITFEEFVTAICASNYETLLDKKNITMLYEIYVAVMAITVNKIGVGYYEIAPDKSFTSDLGVD